jgi:hypothetical protein
LALLLVAHLCEFGMALSLVVTSLATLAFVAVDGVRVPAKKRPASTQDSLILEAQASLVNSSYTPNTGCQGSVELHHTYGDTRDNCGGQFETEMNNPYTGSSHKKQPPHGGWFMVSTTSRRRHRWYCSNTAEKHDCGGGNCMRVKHHSRRRFPVTCGRCTCHQPRAIRSEVCLRSKEAFQGGSSGHLNRTISHSIGTFRQSYTTQDTVHEASVAASANIQGVIPSIGGTFGVTAETRYGVTSALHSAYTESYTSEYNVTETLYLDMSLPVYILHAQNYIYFEDGSVARLSGRTLLQFSQPVGAGCQEIWASR